MCLAIEVMVSILEVNMGRMDELANSILETIKSVVMKEVWQMVYGSEYVRIKNKLITNWVFFKISRLIISLMINQNE